MQILVPIAGLSPFFKPEDYHFPKPLIEVAGKPMIQLVLENLVDISPDAKFLFVTAWEDTAKYSLASALSLLSPTCKVISLREKCNGALCSCLMTVDDLEEDEPLIIANGDQIIDASLKSIIADLELKCVDAGVITFESIHPRWSYVKTDADGTVLQAAEKQVISNSAIAGVYYFKKASLFIEAAKKCIIGSSTTNGQYYISATLNELILEGKEVQAVRISNDAFHSFYSPAKIQEFEDKRQLQQVRSSKAVNVVIPAAGEGSRFKAAGYEKPKPFIDVLGVPMIQHVIGNVTPENSKVHVIFRKAHMEAEPGVAGKLVAGGIQLHAADRLTEGTACTLLLHRPVFDNDTPLLVANSDQYVDFSVDAFVNDCRRRGLDGSILVFKDPTMDPKWSFAKIDENGLVTEVAEKKPISDLATVGIYLFSKGSEFVSAAIDMIARNDRVNNEFYTCPVYNYMIANGARIGVYEIPQHAMHGLGIPADLDAFIRFKQPDGAAVAK